MAVTEKMYAFSRWMVALGGALLALLGLLWAAWQMDQDPISGMMAQLRWWPAIGLAVLSYLAGHVLRGLRCRLLVSPDTRLGLMSAIQIVVIGYAGNNLLPFRLGELVRVGLLAERTGLPLPQALMVTAAERLFDGLILLVLLSFSVFWLPPLAAWDPGAWWLVGLLVLALVLCLWAAVAPAVVIRLVSRMAPARIRPRLVRWASEAARGLVYVRRAGPLSRILGLSLAIWLLESLMVGAVLWAFGTAVHPLWALGIMAFSNLALLRPTGPGHVVVFRHFAVQALVLLGIAPHLAGAVAVGLHLTFFVPITLFGVLAILWYGIRVGGQGIRLRKALNDSGQPVEGFEGVRLVTQLTEGRREVKVGVFLRSLVEAVLPAEETISDPVVRERVIEEVATFSAKQLVALPRTLRLLYFCGMLAFRSLCLIYGLGRFETRSLVKRRRYLALWAYGPIGLGRMLFRPLRSVALLAFFEHQVVCDLRRGVGGQA